MPTTRFIRLGIVVFVCLAASPAFAQVSLYDERNDPTPPQGWSVTPSLGYATIWDDNALIRGDGEVLPGDLTNSINPRLAANYSRRRSQFEATYDGSFVAYRELSSLNSFDQRMSAQGRRLLTRRLSWFARTSFSESPTTEAIGIVGVPFVRVGSRLSDTRTGIEATVSRHTTIRADYGAQWLSFDDEPVLGLQLAGGHNHGGSAGIRHALSPRTVLLGNYDHQFASVTDNSHFTIQNAQGGIELEPWEGVQVFGTAGFSRLSYTGLTETRLGPAFSAGLSRRLRTGGWDIAYSRAFVPSFGFAGTTENEELSSRLLVPLGPRFYARGGFAWRRNEPLVRGQLRLKSTWTEGGFGYAATPWMNIEGFYDGTRQEIDRPGGHLVRNRVGMQVITAKPMRIR